MAKSDDFSKHVMQAVEEELKEGQYTKSEQDAARKILGKALKTRLSKRPHCASMLQGC